MKELETHLKIENQERIELNVKKKQEIEYVLEGTIKPKNGHFVWEINEQTGEIKKAEYKQDSVAYNAFAEKEPEKLIINEGCTYIPSLNAKNARRHYENNPNQSVYFEKPPMADIKEIFAIKRDNLIF